MDPKQKQLADGEITMLRLRVFNDREAELLKDGKSPMEAHEGASAHLLHLENTRSGEYLRKRDRQARRKARKQDVGGGEDASLGG
jgi:hypothetical protein